MSEIQFDIDQVQYRSRTVLGQPQVPSMASWLMKKGIIKNESQAGSLLVGVVFLNFILAGLVVYFFVL